MEKYSKWKDPATGIQPFLDIKPKKRNQMMGAERLIWGIKLFLLGPILCLLRLVLLFIMLVWFALVTTVFSVVPIPILRRFFLRYAHALGSRAMLFVLGFHWIQSSTIDPRVRNKPSPVSAASRIQNGDIVVCNYTSYVQVLYLSFRLCPTFVSLVRCDASHPKAGYGVTRGLFGAVVDVLLDRHPDVSSPNLRPLRAIAEEAKSRRGGPVVVFAEGTTSNGQVVLRFLPCLNKALLVPPTPALHIVGTQFEVGQGYASVGVNPAFTTGSPVKHVLRMLFVFNQTMAVTYCAPEACARLAESVSGATGEDYCEAVSKLLASLMQVHRALIGTTEKVEFMEYFKKIENTGYKKKQG